MPYDLGIRFVMARKRGSGNHVRFGSRRVRLLAGVWMDQEAEWGMPGLSWSFQSETLA